MKKNACIVPECDSTDTSKPSVTLHLIPKDDDATRKKWLKAINRTEDEVNKRSKVCSKHFKSSDYSVTRLNYTMGTKNNPTGSEFKALKTEAVPSLNLPPKSTFKIKISKKDNNSKEIKVEEVKVKEEKDKEKVKMPKKHHVELSPPRVRTQSRRAASKEALKQMQLLLDDEDDTVEIPDDDMIHVAPSPPPPPPPKKKYKLSHRKSSDGNDRDVIVLKSITNRNAENTLELDCWVEQLEDVQKQRIKKMQDEEKELQAKLDMLVSQANAKIIHKGDLSTIIEVTEQVQSAITGAKAPPTNLVLNNVSSGQQSYQLVMDPRSGVIVGAVATPSTPASPATPTPKVYQGKVQVAQNLQQTPTTSSSIANQSLSNRGVRTRRGAAAQATPPSSVSIQSPQTRSLATNQTRATANQTRSVTVTPQTRSGPAVQTRSVPATVQTRSVPANQTRSMAAAAANQTRTVLTPPQTRIQARSSIVQQTKAATPTPVKAVQPTAAPKATPPPTRSLLTAKKTTVAAVQQPAVGAIATRQRGQPTPNAFSNARPSETNVEGGLSAGGSGPAKKVVVDLTSEDNRAGVQPDSKEISFNKLQGKTYPSLVVVARPHLRVQDLSVDRPKLDAKVKSVLMHAPTKFTEWLIQQGLVRSEQKCTVHATTPLKLGMYSDVSKFPYSGGYVWISECCPQRFVSVFSGSLFEGSPHPPMVILKLLYHWACQTNIQNVTQWVKVDNLYVKGMFTWLRSICTVALQTHIRQLGGPGVRVEVGVISLGTTSQDGNQRQVKVEVLGVLETTTKLIRLRAVEPQAEGDRNYKKRFSKILEPIYQWVHPQSVLVADLTVDKQTLIGMGFANVVQSPTASAPSTEYGTNKQIMEYLRRIVPRMFQNTLSLLSRQIIQQFLDELVWREWFGTSSLQAFDNLVVHMAEQTRFDSNQSLIVRLNKVAQNPFKNWSIPLTNATKVVENASNTNKKQRARKVAADAPKATPQQQQQSVVISSEALRPPKSTSPDVPEQMVPLENYYYGTVDTYSKTPSIVLNMKCPFCKSTFDNNIQLMNHLFKHAHNVSQDAQLCRYCLTSVTTANDLLKHIATSHPAETKFDNGFVCLICETQYMNPFVLGKHMSKEHCPSELPYQCGTCGYRCSNHKQAIDHFYRTHDNGPTIQCPFCLKSTTVFSSSRNIVQNMNYFIQHLQKHQRKQFARRCGKCNLWFVQKDVLKEHQTRMHVSQRGKPGLVPWNAPRNGVMVPKSRMDKYPGDGEVINFGTLHFSVSKNLTCKECNTPMDTAKHFPSFESCQNPNCQYSTCCTNAMQEHNAKCNKSHTPLAEEKLPFEMFCICGYSHTDGNQLARHLAICERKSAYPSRSDAKSATVTHSMLDVLGLVRKPEEAAKAVGTAKRKSEAVMKEEGPVPVAKTMEGPKSAKRRKVENAPENKSVESEQAVEVPRAKRTKREKSPEREVDVVETKRLKKETLAEKKKKQIVAVEKKEKDPAVDDKDSETNQNEEETVFKTVEEEQKTVGEDNKTGEEDNKTGEEDNKTGEEEHKTLEEEPKAAGEDPKAVEEKPIAIEKDLESSDEKRAGDESRTVEEESVAQEAAVVKNDESEAVEEESKAVEDTEVVEEPKSVEEPEFVDEHKSLGETISETVEEQPETVEEPKAVEDEIRAAHGDESKLTDIEESETDGVANAVEDELEAVAQETIAEVEKETQAVEDSDMRVPEEVPESVEKTELPVEKERQECVEEQPPGRAEDEEMVVDEEKEEERSAVSETTLKEIEERQEGIRNHESDPSESEITSEDIQSLLSDVVGEKLNPAEILDHPKDVEPETDISGMSNGDIQAADGSTEVIESEFSAMETD